jgi:AcrR family transcriptional regulator
MKSVTGQVTTKPTKAAYHHGNLKAALIAAGLKEITQHGIDGFSLRGVARRAGVSAPAVYRHFADKDDLIASLAMEAWERLVAVSTEAMAKAPPSALEQFRASGMSLVRFAVANPEHFRVICLPGAFERAPAEFRAKFEAAQVANLAGLAQAQAAGELADLPLEDLMLAANALVMGLAHQIIEGRLGDVDDKRAMQLAHRATTVLGVGLIPRTDDAYEQAIAVMPEPKLGIVPRAASKKRTK